MDWRRPTWLTLYSLTLDFLVNSAWPSLRAGVPVCPWTRAGLPGGRSTACRWTSWSTTPAFIIDLGTDCTTDTRGQYLALSKTWRSCYYCVCGTGCTADTALHDRRPSVPRRCGWHELGTVCHQKWSLHSICERSRLNSRLVCFPFFPIADCEVTVGPLAFFSLNFILLYCIATSTEAVASQSILVDTSWINVEKSGWNIYCRVHGRRNKRLILQIDLACSYWTKARSGWLRLAVAICSCWYLTANLWNVLLSAMTCLVLLSRNLRQWDDFHGRKSFAVWFNISSGANAAMEMLIVSDLYKIHC